MSYFDLHIHTYHSLDSANHPREIVKVARRRGLSGVAITDHNTIKGGIEVARYNKFDDLYVIVGKEIKTEQCEVIGLFLNEEISSTRPFDVLDEIRDQGGLSILPHPFRSKLLPRRGSEKGFTIDLVKRIDAIEVFNSRSAYSWNKKAFFLATKMEKAMVAGSDAHFYPEIGRGRTIIPHFNDEEDLKRMILGGKIVVEEQVNSLIKGLPFYVLSFFYGRIRKVSNYI